MSVCCAEYGEFGVNSLSAVIVKVLCALNKRNLQMEAAATSKLSDSRYKNQGDIGDSNYKLAYHTVGFNSLNENSVHYHKLQ